MLQGIFSSMHEQMLVPPLAHDADSLTNESECQKTIRGILE